ncbi:hypothetical protein [Salinisphaera aquimarina]|uniref:Uncharacterized protein n=1 Tax=Salinisphaera aquimarina TaxID=2094031 RepID=A0ABV7EHY7_9GAMM
MSDKPATSLSYHGQNNRHSPELQAERDKVRSEFRVQIVASDALVAHSSRLNGKSANDILELVNAKGANRYSYWNEVKSLDDIGLIIDKINANWSVIHQITGIDSEPYIPGILPFSPHLIRKGEIYVPLARGGV